jgi:PAS domain S-box-containing protein
MFLNYSRKNKFGKSMTENLSKSAKKEIVKKIILDLHKGLSPVEAKERFEKEVGSITSMEIAEIEQSLINEGLTPEEIKKFCNVHALLFESALKKAVIKEESPAHPVYLFKLENREIEKIVAGIRDIIKNRQKYELAAWKAKMKEMLLGLRGIDTHYQRKEQVLFPYLERHGFYGPSKVMWGKDNEIREMLKNAIVNLDSVNERTCEDYVSRFLNPLIDEVEGMIFKEENILFPSSVEMLTPEEWVEVLKESDGLGYVYIEKPKETSALIEELKRALVEEPFIKDRAIVSFPTGDLSLKELMCLLNTLPVDVTFVDREDKVRYFNSPKSKIFVRTKSVLGRKVQHCHPPQSVDKVEAILNSFKEGTRDVAEFWINYRGRLVHIRYFAVRDENRNYMGTMEVVQDISEIKKLEGERRLLDEKA